MLKKIYLKYAIESGRQDKVQATIKPDFKPIKSQPYDKSPAKTIFLEIEVDIPEELFGVRKIKIINQKLIEEENAD